MADSFDAFRYLNYLRARWRWIAASCAVSVALALAVSMAMPCQYTATARLVIDPPAGTDLRSAMAVSPIYLESLKTYEEFAAGDSVFQKAIDKFHLRASLGSGSIESLKKRVLKVGLVHNTRILEISATLPDAKRAQELAKYLADSTVELNRVVGAEADQELLQGLEQQEHDIRADVENMEAAWAHQIAEEPIGDLQAALSKAAELRLTLQQQILDTQLELADAADREKQASAVEQSEARKEASNATARVAELRKQLQDLQHQSAENERLLAVRNGHRDKLDAERKAAQTALIGIQTRLREARGESGHRGERLRVIDPGIVPERPSSPNVPLNLFGALLLGLVLPILYLTLAMSYEEQKVTERRSVFQTIPKARNE